MMDVKISIIVPVYNTEKYLSRCMESILSQTFHDIEVILVDDGSTDGSAKLCDEFAKRDSRVRVIHQKNAGVSAARNAGIDAARGEWIGFVDSDDWIDEETYEVAYNTAIEQNADMVIWGFAVTDYISIDKTRIHGVITILEIASKTALDMNSACTTLCSKDLVMRHNIRFPEGVKFMEDTFFCAMCYLYAKKIFSIQNLFYYYFSNHDSSTNNINVEKICGGIEVIKKLEKIVEKENKAMQWKLFFFDQKIEAKNRFLFFLNPPNFKLFRKTFPELNTHFLKERRPFVLVYWAIFLHMDFFASALMKLQKWLHRNDGLKASKKSAI